MNSKCMTNFMFLVHFSHTSEHIAGEGVGDCSCRQPLFDLKHLFSLRDLECMIRSNCPSIWLDEPYVRLKTVGAIFVMRKRNAIRMPKC